MANKYVDYSSTNDGDGTTAAQAGSPGGAGAFNTLAGKTFSAGDNIWVRRVTSAAIGATTTLSQTVGCSIIGWPKSGDALFSSRPASGTSNGWDSDSNNYAVLLYNSASFNLAITGQNYTFYRISAQQNAASAIVGSISGTTNTFYDCYWFHNNATQITTAGDTTISAGSNIFVRCLWQGSNNGNNGNSCLLNISAGTNSKFYDCSLTASSTAAAGNTLKIQTADHLFQNLTINITGGTSALTVVNITSGGVNIKIFGLNIVASGGVTTYNGLLVAGANNYISNYSTNSGGGGTAGHLSVSGSNNIVMISDFTQNPTTGTNGINVTGAGNHIVLKNGTFQGNTQDINLSTLANNIVYCNNIVFSSSPIIAIGYHETSGLWSYNHGQTAGAFKHIHLHGEINASNTYRTGGESFSFKFESLSAGTGERGQLQLGIPGVETIWVFLAAGSRTVTLYGAHKGFSSTPPLGHNIWFEFEYLNASNKYAIATSYGYATALTSDGSTWNNDSSLTPFSLSVTVTVNADCIIPIRMYYHDFVASAYTYIDPKAAVA